jgi:hypothetical protein
MGPLQKTPRRAKPHHSLSTLAYTEPHTIHLRDGEVALFNRRHSVLRQCRYKFANGTWHRTSTGCASIEAAVATNL